MTYELAEKYQAFNTNPKYAGVSNFYKMMIFAHENNISNDDIDYYMALPPHTYEDETKEEMKLRRKFSSLLIKYRPYLYDYSVYEN